MMGVNGKKQRDPDILLKYIPILTWLTHHFKGRLWLQYKNFVNRHCTSQSSAVDNRISFQHKRYKCWSLYVRDSYV